MGTLLTILSYIAAIAIGSRFQPWVSKRNGIWYLDYSSTRGVRNQYKLF